MKTRIRRIWIKSKLEYLVDNEADVITWVGNPHRQKIGTH
jgi:hypothetical protein